VFYVSVKVETYFSIIMCLCAFRL